MHKFLGKIGDWRFDVVIRWGSFWVGVHKSRRYESYCIAFIPFVVLRVGKTSYVGLQY